MANYGYVTTRKKFKPEQITKIVEDLNKERFKNVLTITSEKIDDSSDFTHIWEIRYNGKIFPEDNSIPHDILIRTFWLKSSRKFVMRHGSGGHFCWWIDNSIINEVALAYDGMISDDGIDDKWKGETKKYTTFNEFNEEMFAHIKDSAQRLSVILYYEKMVPTPFRSIQFDFIKNW